MPRIEYMFDIGDDSGHTPGGLCGRTPTPA
jgi:hypothetical protein